MKEINKGHSLKVYKITAYTLLGMWENQGNVGSMWLVIKPLPNVNLV